MDNNEIMNEGIEMIEIPAVDEGTGIGAGKAVLIGVGVTIAVCAAVKLGKKLYAKYQAKKALRQPDEEIEVDDEDVAEVGAK
jgi:hypothetical protein